MRDSHYICFDDQEFTVLLSAMQVDSATCFETDSRVRVTQADYDRGLFSLYKRELIKVSETDKAFAIGEECKRMFSALKNSRYMLRLECKGQTITQYGLYVSGGDCTVISPGVRAHEYVRMAVFPIDEISDFLTESGMMADDAVMPQNDESLGLLSAHDEAWVHFLEEHPEPDDPMLYAYETVFMRALQLDNRTGVTETALYLVREPLQSKLVLILADGRVEVKPYAKDTMMSLLIQMMEG